MMNMNIILVLLIGAVYCQELTVSEDSDDNVREMREFNPEGWRAVQAFPEGDPDWIPRDDSEQVKPKRRRLRKRKRRPPILENVEGDVPIFRRRIRPYRIEPWEELSEENIKPNNRRRMPLPYPSLEEIDRENISSTENDSGNQRKDIEEKPLAASILVEEKHEPQLMQNSIADLKNLLKQSGGKLSLSEILQQKNLSLAELLNGNEKISALTEQPLNILSSTETVREQITKYKRLPPSVVLKTNKNTIQEESADETLTEVETIEAQRKRLTLLQPKENKIFANVIKFDVVTEPTTERRIFIPSNSKFVGVEYTRVNPNEEYETTTEKRAISSTQSTTTTTTENTRKTTSTENTKKPTSTKLIRNRNKLPTTNAKLRTTTKKMNLSEKERYPSNFEFAKPIKIDIDQIIGFVNEDINKKNDEKIANEDINKTNDEKIVNDDKTEGPMRVSIDLETIFATINNKTVEDLMTPVQIVVKEPELTTTDVSEKQNETYVTAKQEIMEVLKDPVSREKLSRILENRNMTLKELVEQRERGSSQLHLADIFHNKTREPEPKDEPFIGEISPEFFQPIKTTNRQQKSTKLDDISLTTSTTELSTSAMKVVPTKFPTVTVKFNKTDSVDTFPWKQLYPDLFPESKETDQIESSEDLNRISQRVDIERNLSYTEEGFFASIPSGVKSALFVSLAIIGLSIVVFLAILVIFRWTQRKNRSLNYCSSLTTKLRSPMLQGRPTTAIKTFMNETLRRKKNYYKTSLQSMSDEIWDSNRDRKESF